MSELPYISILIPVYDVEPYIEKCIQSVMAQTYTGGIECIIVDDCGTDNSIAIAEQLITEYNGSIDFKIIRHEHNRGLAAASNTAVAAAKGEFIIHVDSDDWIEPTMVEELVKRQQEIGADIVSCNAIAHYIDREEKLIEPDYASKEEMMRSLIKMSLDHVIWRRLIRTSLYKENNITAIEEVNIGEDHYTMPRLLYYAKSFAKYDKALYHYNCLNVGSYMQSSSTSFNALRVKSDVESLNILIGFFNVKDPIYLEQLYAIKVKYIYSNFFVILKHGNKALYKELSTDWKSIEYSYKEKVGVKAISDKLLAPFLYYLNRIRVFSRILIKKIFGIRLYDL